MVSNHCSKHSYPQLGRLSVLPLVRVAQFIECRLVAACIVRTSHSPNIFRCFSSSLSYLPTVASSFEIALLLVKCHIPVTPSVIQHKLYLFKKLFKFCSCLHGFINSFWRPLLLIVVVWKLCCKALALSFSNSIITARVYYCAQYFYFMA